MRAKREVIVEQGVEEPLVGNQLFVSSGLKEAVMWPNGSKSAQIETAPDFLQKATYHQKITRAFI